MTARAACAELDSVEADKLFFSKPYQQLARVICQRCPLAQACLTKAIEDEGDLPAGYRFGVYGGTTPIERYRAVVR